MVPAGSILTYNATFSTTYTSSLNDVLSSVGDALAPSGITIESQNFTEPDLLSMVADAATFSGFTVQGSMQVQVSGSYNQPNDVKSIIDNAIYQVTGSLPSSSSISQVNGTATGQPAASASTTPSFLSGVSSWFSNLGTTSLFGVGLAFLAIVAGILLFATEKGRE